MSNEKTAKELIIGNEPITWISEKYPEAYMRLFIERFPKKSYLHDRAKYLCYGKCDKRGCIWPKEFQRLAIEAFQPPNNDFDRLFTPNGFTRQLESREQQKAASRRTNNVKRGNKIIGGVAYALYSALKKAHHHGMVLTQVDGLSFKLDYQIEGQRGPMLNESRTITPDGVQNNLPESVAV